jgi:L-ascorbate metabolism protein UlaG (beta-lactamase superfamily)
MKITFYGYNSFIIESGNKKIAIDPGALFLYYFKLTTLIPKSKWPDITHILVTHGDTDHYWHMDRVAAESHAPVICNTTMVKKIKGTSLLLGPRERGVAFTTQLEKLHTLAVDEEIEVDGITVAGIKATHGPLTLKLGPVSKTVSPGPNERIGWGAIGFKIQIEGKTVVNLGDTLLQAEEWQSIKSPDLLMIPIGGKYAHNTMDGLEAIEAVKIMQPKQVIPCHYNVPAFFTKHYCAADDALFRHEVERTGRKCIILRSGESVRI